MSVLRQSARLNRAHDGYLTVMLSALFSSGIYIGGGFLGLVLLVVIVVLILR